MAVEEAGLLDLRQSLALVEVDQAPPVELTLGLPRLLVHLGDDVLDQVQLSRTKRNTGCLQCVMLIVKNVSL